MDDCKLFTYFTTFLCNHCAFVAFIFLRILLAAIIYSFLTLCIFGDYCHLHLLAGIIIFLCNQIYLGLMADMYHYLQPLCINGIHVCLHLLIGIHILLLFIGRYLPPFLAITVHSWYLYSSASYRQVFIYPFLITCISGDCNRFRTENNASFNRL